MTNYSDRIPSDYQPISMWGYFGYQLLFSIPVIGWIIVIVFALTASNRNLRNFARSQFCLQIIWLAAICISVFSGFFTAILESLAR